MDQGQDPTVRSYRERISAADRTLVETFNRRLALVQELHAYKAERGYPAVDPAREKAMRADLGEANAGPLSQAGLEELVGEILDLTKRELGRSAGASGDRVG